jgi:hypothetical protein
MTSSSKVTEFESSSLQLLDKLPFLVERANEFLNTLGLKVQVVQHSEKWYDPGIELGDSGIGITITWGTRPSIAGRIDEVQFSAYKTVHIPGNRWVPDDADIIDLSVASSNCENAIIEAIKEYVRFVICQKLDAEADDAYAEEIYS